MKQKVDTSTGEIIVARPTIKTHWNAHLFPHRGEVNLQPSRTLPDQTLSLREIRARHEAGLTVDDIKVPLYQGEDSVLPPDWATWDLADKEYFLYQHNEHMKELRAQLEKDAKQKKEERLKQTAEYEKLKKDKEDKDLQERMRQFLDRKNNGSSNEA